MNASFEHAALRSSTGNLGFIDLFWPGVLLVEQKSAKKSLDEAKFQALDYLPSLTEVELPRALVMSDFDRIKIVYLDGDFREEYTFDTLQLAEEVDRFDFLTHERKALVEHEERANAAAVSLMGLLHKQLATSGYQGHDVSVFMVRLLFLMFGDDTGLWPKALFETFIVDRTVPDGTDCGPQLAALFQTLDTPDEKRSPHLDQSLKRFPYVNGGLFHERIEIPTFSVEMRSALLACSAYDWSQISPAIFGSMFQTVKPKVERRETGEHYTTEANILKTIEPLFLAELRDRFSSCGSDLSRLNTFHRSMSKLKFFDPACGCGNFLVIAYRELRELELDVLRKIRAVSGQDVLDIDITQTLRISPTQFYGIELNEWPAEIAKTAFFMIDHQANKQLALEFGQAPDRLPITLTANIVTGDALELDWAKVVQPDADTIIFGNPPFIGDRNMTPHNRTSLTRVWGRKTAHLDFVTGWYKKAIDYFGDLHGRWAFVSTNSVCQGEPVADLWPPLIEAEWRCRFAYRSFVWNSEASGAAAVHVSIVGFDRAKSSPRPVLWVHDDDGRGDSEPKAVTRINPYLVDAPMVVIPPRQFPINPSMPEVAYGNMARDGGHLLIEPDEYDEVMADQIASKYVRPFVGAEELLHRKERWCLWLTEMQPGEERRSPVLRSRLQSVRDSRLKMKAEATRKLSATPQLFAQRKEMHSRYLSIPRHVSVMFPFFTPAYYEPTTITGDANFVAPDPDGFLLGVLSSSMFMTWMKTIGGRIKSDPRFSKTHVYNSFPLPLISEKARNEISTRAQEIAAIRGHYDTYSLAELYGQGAIPIRVMDAHRKLDRAVDATFGSRKVVDTVDDRQRMLFRSYIRLTDQGQED